MNFALIWSDYYLRIPTTIQIICCFGTCHFTTAVDTSNRYSLQGAYVVGLVILIGKSWCAFYDGMTKTEPTKKATAYMVTLFCAKGSYSSQHVNFFDLIVSLDWECGMLRKRNRTAFQYCADLFSGLNFWQSCHVSAVKSWRSGISFKRRAHSGFSARSTIRWRDESYRFRFGSCASISERYLWLYSLDKP